MTLVSLIVIPLSLVMIMLVVKKSQKHFRAQQEYLGHTNGHIEEMYEVVIAIMKVPLMVKKKLLKNLTN